MAEKELVHRLEKAALDTRINLLNLCHQKAISEVKDAYTEKWGVEE